MTRLKQEIKLRGMPAQLLIVTVRPRESFCPIRQALDANDESFINCYAGAATANLILNLELDRREQNRTKAVKRKIGRRIKL